MGEHAYNPNLPDCPVDVFDLGPRFRSKRYAVRIRSRDGSKALVVDYYESRSAAEWMGKLAREALESWGIPADD